MGFNLLWSRLVTFLKWSQKLSHFKLELMLITISFRNYYDFTTQTFLQKLPHNPLSLLSHLHQKIILNPPYCPWSVFMPEKLHPLSSLLPQIHIWKTNNPIIASCMQSCICPLFFIEQSQESCKLNVSHVYATKTIECYICNKNLHLQT